MRSEAPEVRVSRLSKRQLECLRGVARHLDSQQIAADLGLSPHTVDGHISAAVKALGARSRRDAVRLLASVIGPGEQLTGQFPPVVSPAPSRLDETAPGGVREDQSRFIGAPHQSPEDRRNDQHLSNPLVTIALIVAIAAGLAIALVAMKPLIDGAASLANQIKPFHTN